MDGKEKYKKPINICRAGALACARSEHGDGDRPQRRPCTDGSGWGQLHCGKRISTRGRPGDLSSLSLIWLMRRLQNELNVLQSRKPNPRRERREAPGVAGGGFGGGR